jgi:hypothetical protein
MSTFWGIDLDQISGGDAGGSVVTGDSGTATSASSSLEQFITDEGGILAEAYGEHLVGGFLIAHKYDAGPPPSSKIIVAGGAGEWDSVVTAWYAGDPLSASPDGSTEGYHFYPGTISTSVTDPTQPVDSFLSSGLAYNATAYLAVKLPERYATEDRPDKLKWRAKCKKIYSYDASGNPTASTAYSVNPADVAVDRIRRYYQLVYPDDATLAAKAFRDRVDWPSYKEFYDYCAEEISWNNGTSTVSIPRFECHAVFLQSATLDDALRLICSTAASWYQDDGERIRFVKPTDTTPVHHFSPANIVNGSLTITPRDIRERPNYLVAEFRDLDDSYLKVSQTPPAYRQPLIDKVGVVNPGKRAFPNMNRSQAQRLLQRQLRLEADNPNIVNLRGMADSFHVLPGDYVTVSHPVPNWHYQPCLVLEIAADSGEKAADEIDFTLQAIDSPILYSDDDHTPEQEELAP